MENTMFDFDDPEPDDSFFGLDLDLDGDADAFDDFLGLAILHRLARREGAFGPQRGTWRASARGPGCLDLALLLAAALFILPLLGSYRPHSVIRSTFVDRENLHP